jgi:hypothetical protein
MILLVTSSERASECAEALHGGTGETIVVAESLARASTLLREDSLSGGGARSVPARNRT